MSSLEGLPGKFTLDRTVFVFPTLAYAGARGAIHLWTIRVRLLSFAPAEKHGETNSTEWPVGLGGYTPMTDAMLRRPELEGFKAEITVESLQRGGKVRDVMPTYVSTGKNLGKKNATNCLTQAIRDARGLYARQLKRGDVSPAGDSAPAATAPAATAPAATAPAATAVAAPAPAATAVAAPAPARPPPMLVKKIGESREAILGPAEFAAGVTVQRKLNGVRFVVYADKISLPTHSSSPSGADLSRLEEPCYPTLARVGEDFPNPGRGTPRLIRYSRTGAEYPGQEQIVAELAPMMLAGALAGAPAEASAEVVDSVVPLGTTLRQCSDTPYFDGELYAHGQPLNWISGQARRGDDAGSLEFHIFDVFFPGAMAAGRDMKSRDRQAYLDAWFAAADAAGLAHPHVVRVENFPAESAAVMNTLAQRFLLEGYEGAIARKDDAGYRYGYSNYHSTNVLKIKPKFDAEFRVVGFTQGTRGKDVGAVIWICEVASPVNPLDKTFNVVPKDMEYKTRYALFECLNQMVEPVGSPLVSAESPRAGIDTPRLVTRFERDIKGLPLTVEYAEISIKTGKPLQAKALAFRTYESGPEKDPICRLLLMCGGGYNGDLQQ